MPRRTNDRKPPKLISPSDPCSAWTAKANKRVQFGYGLNYLIDIENAIIVDVEATPARTYDEDEVNKEDARPHRAALWLKPKRLAADTAYGTGASWAGWLAAGLHCTSRSAMPASATMAHYRAAIFAGTGGGAFTSARTVRCFAPPARCTKANASLSRIQVRLRCLCPQDAVLS